MDQQRIADGEQFEATGPERTPGSTGLEGLGDEVLLQQLAGVIESQMFLFESRERYEKEIQDRMEASGATVMQHDAFEEIVLKGSPTYDQGVLGPLGDLLTARDHQHAWVPEAQKPIPGHYDMTKLKPLKKLGGRILELIEAAEVPGKKQLRLKLRKENNND